MNNASLFFGVALLVILCSSILGSFAAKDVYFENILTCGLKNRSWQEIYGMITIKSEVPVVIVTEEDETNSGYYAYPLGTYPYSYINVVVKSNCDNDTTIADTILIEDNGNCTSATDPYVPRECVIKISGDLLNPDNITEYGDDACNAKFVPPVQGPYVGHGYPSGAVMLQKNWFVLVLAVLFGLIAVGKKNTGLLLIGLCIMAPLFLSWSGNQAIGLERICHTWVEIVVQQGCSYSTFSVDAPNYNSTLLHPACPVEGRPYVTESGQLMAVTNVRGNDWISQLEPVANSNMYTKEKKAEKWLHTALGEHSSVASFSVFSLQLLSVGAPADLVMRAHQAALDEIKHAQLSFGLASSFSGIPFSPGDFQPHTISIEPNLLSICSATAREGCVAETISTLKAASELEEETDPTVQSVLETIIYDESKHSILAWDTIKWCVERNQTLSIPLNEVIQDELSSIPDKYIVGVELIESLANSILLHQQTIPNFNINENQRSVEIAHSIFKQLISEPRKDIL